MSRPNWCDLLVSKGGLRAMPADKLESLSNAGNDYVHALAQGVSGVGNLLACTARNNETGLDKDAVANVGWMIECLGGLISNLIDVVDETEYLASESKASAKRKGGAK